MRPTPQANRGLLLSRSVSPEARLTPSTSPRKLIRIARQFQLDKNSALSEVNQLRRKLADITNESDEEGGNTVDFPPAPKRSRTSAARHDQVNIETAEDTLIKDAGHLFVIIHGPWLHEGDATFKSTYNSEIRDAERFENDENKKQGQLHEIMQLLGPKLADRMHVEPWIGKLFTKGMKAQRSNTASRLRHNCAILFGVSDTDMLDAQVRREKFKHRIGWVDNGRGSGAYSSVDVELLHKDYSGHYDIKTVFLNPILMWVFTSVIRGPTAAKQLMRGIVTDIRTETMARKHGIRHTTPGAIATAAILARWCLSSDELLQRVGTNTGINYERDFHEYLEVLITGLRKKKRCIIEVFREWDQVIFPSSDSSLVLNEHHGSTSLKIALDMLEAEEVDEGDVVDSVST